MFAAEPKLALRKTTGEADVAPVFHEKISPSVNAPLPPGRIGFCHAPAEPWVPVSLICKHVVTSGPMHRAGIVQNYLASVSSADLLVKQDVSLPLSRALFVLRALAAAAKSNKHLSPHLSPLLAHTWPATGPLLANMWWPQAWPRSGLNVISGHGKAIG